MTMDEARLRTLLEHDLNAGVTEVVRDVGPEIYRFLLATARDEDIASDAFAVWCERIWKSLSTFRWDCSLRSWLYLVAKSAFLDLVRAARRKGARQQPLDSELVAKAAAEVRTATLSLYRTENVDAMARLRESLDEDDRLLLVLRVDRELPWTEIADVFLRSDESVARPADDELARESARLRKRFQLVKERLYELAQETGIIKR